MTAPSRSITFSPPSSPEQRAWIQQWFGNADTEDDREVPWTSEWRTDSAEDADQEARAPLMKDHALWREIDQLCGHAQTFLDGIRCRPFGSACEMLYFSSTSEGSPDDLAALLYMALTRFEDDQATWFRWGMIEADDGCGGMFVIHRTLGIRHNEGDEWVQAQLQEILQLKNAATPAE